MMIIDNKYELGQMVFLKTDADQLEHMVTGITIRPNGFFIYSLTIDKLETEHFDIEISTECNPLKRIEA